MNISDIPDYLPATLKTKWVEVITDFQSAGKDEFEFLAPDSLLSAPVHIVRDRGISLESGSEIKTYDAFEYYTLKEKGYYVIASARQGGGNRECYCDNVTWVNGADEGHDEGCLAANNDEVANHPNFLGDEDDSDSTYNWFLFGNNITEAQAEAFNAHNNRATILNRLKTTFEGVLKGTSPWWILSDTHSNDSAISYEVARRELKNLTANYEANLKVVARWDALIKKAKQNQIDEDLLDQYSVGHPGRRYLLERHAAYKKADEEYQLAELAMAEVESLPEDSAARQFLLGSRGTRSYTATEKRRGRNVQVQRTYEVKPILVDQLQSLKNHLDSATTDLERAKGSYLREPYNLEGTRRAVARTAEVQDKIAVLREAAWASGWNAKDDGPLPVPAPDSF